jgi:glycosyltransferase involved in cell wall biosynthesis
MNSSAPELSIIVPTYREAENLQVLIPRIAAAMQAAGLAWEVIVVDDNSPDDTVAVCAELGRRFPLRLIVRTTERGLSSAVIAGMRQARGRLLVCMDADLSHPPESMPELVAPLRDNAAAPADFVIGSRYVAGGSTADGWGLFRWLNSRAATWLARPLTNVNDPMAGFFALRRADFEAAHSRLNPIGYKIGLELLVKCDCRTVREVPIQFQNRLHGSSKLNLREQMNYARHVARLYEHRFPGIASFVRFCLVGLSGVAVDLTVFTLLLAVALQVPAASVLAIWCAMTWNFVWNRAWTFADSRQAPLWRQYAAFCLGCLLGGLFNWSTRVLLWKYVPFFSAHELAAGAAGVATGTFFNFGLCRLFVFRRPEGDAAPGMADSRNADTQPFVPVAQALADVGHGPAEEVDAGASDPRVATEPVISRRPRIAAMRSLALGALAVGLAFGGETSLDPVRFTAPTAQGADKAARASTPEAASAVGGTLAVRRAPLPTPRAFDLADDAIENRLRESATYLSSDELEGRGIRTRGLDLAANYIADQYREAGLRTDWYTNGPFHEFRLYSRATNGSVQELAFHVPGSEARVLKLNADYTSLSLSVNDKFTLPVAFAGYGITAPEFAYDDYASVDVAGKAVIILRHEPQQNDPMSVFSGVENSDYAFVRPKIDNAVEHGAAMVIFCTDGPAMPAAPETVDEPVMPEESQEALLDVELNDSSLRGSIPVVHCRRSILERLIRATTGEDLAELERRIDAALQPQSRVLKDVRVAGRVGLSREGRTLRNVVASLEGSGPLSEETIVIGAHYDHLGLGGYGSLAIGANAEIHNGADDNASGTAVLMEVARELASRQEPLRRRVLFIAFSAEELGLIGSKRYTQDPVVPLDRTIAMLNLDMVGRMNKGRVTIYGTGTAAEWPALIDRASTAQALTIARRPGGYGPSDHASFFEHGIPVLHFFTGFHPQYHRPSDDSDLLNLQGMRRIAAMVRDITVDLAQADARPTRSNSQGAFDLSEFIEGDDSGLGLELLASDRPRLGVVLEPAEKGGVIVKRILRSTAAERHGIRPGDVIRQVAGKDVNSAADVSEVLKQHKAGEKLTVRLTRRDVELELEITL